MVLNRGKIWRIEVASLIFMLVAVACVTRWQSHRDPISGAATPVVAHPTVPSAEDYAQADPPMPDLEHVHMVGCPEELVAIPAERDKYLINRVKVGEGGWTVPWGMYRDHSGKLWLNGRYWVDRGWAYSPPPGTPSMMVVRTAKGFAVDIEFVPADMRHWSPGEGQYVGGSFPMPVVLVHRGI